MHRDGFSTVDDGESVKNSYYQIPAENFAPGAGNVLIITQQKHNFLDLGR